MLNPKPNSIQVAIKKDKATNNLYEAPKSPGVAKEVNASEIPFWVLLLKLLKSTRIPFVAGKHQLLQKYQEYFSGKPFPWFKLSLLALGLYMLFQKDMHFQVNMKAPDEVFSDDRQSEEPTALSMSLTHLGKMFTKEATKDKDAPQVKAAATKTNNPFPFKDESVAAYIQRFAKISVTEMQKFNIPASIKMGQGILASQAGEHLLATKHNNHFGTLCNAASATCKPYEANGNTVSIKSYESAWESWRDHSTMISQGAYSELAAHGTDYHKWAEGIARIGYNNNQDYSRQLIQVIEKYELFKLDEK